GRSTAAVLTDTFSAPARSRRRASSTVRTPPPTVNGMNTFSATRRATSTMVSRASDDAVMSRKTISSAPSASYRAASSTGSPASRRPTKFTPFTTRPASTSRHGMTRTLRTGGDLQRLGQADSPLIERTADDGAGQPGAADLQAGQGAQVVERPDAAGGHHVEPRGAEPGAELVQVGAGERAVASDLGDDQGGDARAVEALR